MRSKNCDTCGRPMEFSNFGRAPKDCAACKSKLAERERLMHLSGKDLPRRAGLLRDAAARRNSLLAELRELDRVIHSLRAPPPHPGGAPREFAVLPESSTGAVQLRGAPVAREG